MRSQLISAREVGCCHPEPFNFEQVKVERHFRFSRAHLCYCNWTRNDIELRLLACGCWMLRMRGLQISTDLRRVHHVAHPFRSPHKCLNEPTRISTADRRIINHRTRCTCSRKMTISWVMTLREQWRKQIIRQIAILRCHFSVRHALHAS